MPDSERAEWLRADDTASWQHFDELLRPRLLRVAWRLDAANAEDHVQQFATRMLQETTILEPVIRGERSLMGMLVGCLRNQIIAWLRSESARLRREKRAAKLLTDHVEGANVHAATVRDPMQGSDQPNDRRGIRVAPIIELIESATTESTIARRRAALLLLSERVGALIRIGMALARDEYAPHEIEPPPLHVTIEQRMPWRGVAPDWPLFGRPLDQIWRGIVTKLPASLGDLTYQPAFDELGITRACWDQRLKRARDWLIAELELTRRDLITYLPHWPRGRP